MGLGGLFDDSPDSEPGSPDLMSAAWVERMARDPGLQRTLRRGGMPPGFDIVSALERLDLAERRQLIYVGARREEAEQVIEEAEVRADALRAEHAVALAQNAEANRRLAAALELHAIIQAAISGAGGG